LLKDSGRPQATHQLKQVQETSEIEDLSNLLNEVLTDMDGEINTVEENYKTLEDEVNDLVTRISTLETQYSQLVKM